MVKNSGPTSSGEMRICLVNHGDTTSPSAKHSYLLGLNLAKRGHDVTVMFPGNTGAVDAIDAFLRSRKGLRMLILGPILGLRSHYANIIPETAALLSSSYDIVHIWTAKIPLIPAAISKIVHRYKLVVHYEDVEMDMAKEVGVLRQILVRLFTTLADLFADGLTVLTSALRDDARTRYTCKMPILVMGAGADYEMFANPAVPYEFPRNIPDEKIILGLFCSLKSRNSYVEISLKMMKHLDDRFVLVVTGDGKGRPLYESMAVNLGVDGRVVFTGYIEDYRAVPTAMQRCDFLLLPLADNNVNRLRWPGKLTEYMASGRPIVTNPVGPVKTLLNSESAVLVDHADDWEFAEAIKGLALNIIRAKEIGKKAQKVAKRLDWYELSGRVELFYRKLLRS